MSAPRTFTWKCIFCGSRLDVPGADVDPVFRAHANVCTALRDAANKLVEKTVVFFAVRERSKGIES